MKKYKRLIRKTSILLLTGCLFTVNFSYLAKAAQVIGPGANSSDLEDRIEIGPGVTPQLVGDDFIHKEIQDAVVKVSEKYSYDQMAADIQTLQNRYGNRMTVNIIGTSLDNRNIYDVIIGNPSASKHIMIQAGIHAREYMTPLVAMRQMEYALAFYNTGQYNNRTLANMFDQVAVHFLPMTNPDGVSLSQFGIEAIRSEDLRAAILDCYQWDFEQKRTTATLEVYLTQWKSNARGVDLNCNFDSDWLSANGKAIRESYSGFKGYQPLSEPESQALAAIAEQYPWAATLNYHSRGEILYWDATLNQKKDESRGLAESISHVTGYPLDNSLGRAGYKDWMQSKNGSIPGVTLEMGRAACPIPVSEFPDIWEKNKQVWTQAMDYVISH